MAYHLLYGQMGPLPEQKIPWKEKQYFIENKLFCGQNYTSRRNHNVKIWSKTGGYCIYCLIPLTDSNFQADHIIPKSKGGNNDMLNLVPACQKCNGSRNNRDLERWCLMRENFGAIIRLRQLAAQKLIKFKDNIKCA